MLRSSTQKVCESGGTFARARAMAETPLEGVSRGIGS